jgi:hypothetical protein
MRQLFSVLFIIGGLLLAGWCGLVGLSFSGVLLAGFIGTGGREAGPYLAAALAFTVVGVLLGWLIYCGGRKLARVPGAPKG